MPKGPKKKCCTSRPKCGRCPLRMLAEGTLPPGLTVKRRKLVKVKIKGKVKTVAPGSKKRKKPQLPHAA